VVFLNVTNAWLSGMSPGGLTSGATAVSVEVIAVSVLDEAVVEVVGEAAVEVVSDSAVPESFAVQATPNVTRTMGTSDRICALWG
jgi:hypothetical protein